ncbi:unnamed protein product [Thelazia callipaeda]|uniref:Non-lysosomal glucosylceramidase n=1 Tax=Thelazia callipaeda TaxID=103827 RepID=A0A0N5CTB2_THECL|nr:unnamed protein product [Thelazia callipaeda]
MPLQQNTMKQIWVSVQKSFQKNVSLTYATFDPTSDGSSIWSVLYKHGNLEKKDISLEVFQELAIALCAESVCQPNSVVNIEFLLTWDMPVVKFRGGKREYVRRYRRFFRSKNDDFTTELCNHGFSCRLAWEEQINNWQNKILNDHSLPEWYKSALFNELYYMTDGGTIWVEYDESWQKTERNMSEETIRQFKQYGRFAYLESWEYHMMNTYDVHFYSSFAFMVNWPEIELSIQLDYADQVTSVDHHEYYSLYEGTFTKRKNFGRIPHDLGNPCNVFLFTMLFLSSFQLVVAVILPLICS